MVALFPPTNKVEDMNEELVTTPKLVFVLVVDSVDSDSGSF